MVEDISKKLNINPLNNELKQLDLKLEKARLYLDDAENRQLGKPGVKKWLDRFKHVNFQAEDLAEEIENEKSGWTVKGEIGSILTELDNLREQADVLELKHSDGTARGEGSSSTANPAPLLAQHHVFGRNGDKDVILDLLLSNKAFGSQQIGVVPIVGMPGIGKTTLSHLVYHDTTRLLEAEFKSKAWVTVSTDFVVVKILKSLLDQISPGAIVGTEELHQLQLKMRDALTGKKFLIVLDDVWDEDYNNWDLLKSNFEWGVLGSRVVVTTRSGEVGKMVTTGPIHRLSKVSSEDCWSIFINHAFSRGDSNSYPWLHEIGRKIVKKCDGLPLAVKAMGGLLRSERDLTKWGKVLNSHVWESCKNKPSNGVLPSLWLSYRYLPLSLKQCFSYCSVFPQDYTFDKKQMTLLWMAEGFLPSDEKGNGSMEETGEKYFDDLVSRSLFQRSARDESEFVMHDLVHDMAAFVSGEFCVNVAMEDVESKRVTIQTRHLSHCYVPFDSKLSIGLSKAKHLRSFLSQREYGEFFNDEFFKKLITNHRRLRALSIQTADPISASICNLEHLRFLNLSRCKFEEVPSSVCTLFNLQTLILSYCTDLTQLPRDITKLTKLRHLDITGTRLTNMPPQMGNLKELRTLTYFALCDSDGSACSNINEIQKLQHLQGELSISGLKNAAKFGDVGKDILRHKANLKKLVLEWGCIYSTEVSRRADKAVLDALQPHTNLEQLVITNYPYLSFPIWVREMSFEKLVSVELEGIFCDSLPPLGQLPSLLEVVITGFAKVEKIGVEFYGNDFSTTPFRCLETLELYWMESLKEWVFVDKAFPRLKKLKLEGCVGLAVSSIDFKTIEECRIYGNTCLECFPLDQFPKLRKLFLRECRNLKSVTNDGNSESLTKMEILDCSKLIAPQTRLDLQNLAALESLSISHCKCESTASSSSSELFAQVLLPNSSFSPAQFSSRL